MSVKGIPYPSEPTGETSPLGFPLGDRPVTSRDWARYVGRMFTDGYFDQDTASLAVTARTGLSVAITPGACMIQGRQGVIEDEPYVIQLDPADVVNPRIDVIVMRRDLTPNVRATVPVVLKGEPAAAPEPQPIVRNDEVWELALALVHVAPHQTVIAPHDITDLRDDPALCGRVSVIGRGTYYPPGTVPDILWYYTMYPETLTPQQTATVEADEGMMEIWERSRISLAAPKPLIASYTLAGNYTWTVPEDLIGDTVDVLVVGGGDRGQPASISGVSGAGGRGGAVRLYRDVPVAIAEEIALTVGAGGINVAMTGGFSQFLDSTYKQFGGMGGFGGNRGASSPGLWAFVNPYDGQKYGWGGGSSAQSSSVYAGNGGSGGGSSTSPGGSRGADGINNGGLGSGLGDGYGTGGGGAVQNQEPGEGADGCVRIYGKTASGDVRRFLTNHIQNAEFNGTAGWTHGQGGSTGTFTVLNGIGTLTSTAASSNLTIIPTTNFYRGKMYIRTKLKTNWTVTNLTIRYSNAAVTSPEAGQEYIVSGILTGNSPPSFDTTSASQTSGWTLSISEPILIDITSIFGAGSEPDAAWCDANIPFFTGTQEMVI